MDKSGTLLVRLAEGDLSEADGQLHFEFTQAPPPTDSSLMRIAPGPRSAADWLTQGLEQEREGFLEEAAASYRQALLTGGPDAQTCFNLANVLRSLGNKPQALERYSQAVEVDPSFADAWNNMGTLLVELGKPDEACVAFDRALACVRGGRSGQRMGNLRAQAVGELSVATSMQSKAHPRSRGPCRRPNLHPHARDADGGLWGTFTANQANPASPADSAA